MHNQALCRSQSTQCRSLCGLVFGLNVRPCSNHTWPQRTSCDLLHTVCLQGQSPWSWRVLQRQPCLPPALLHWHPHQTRGMPLHSAAWLPLRRQLCAARRSPRPKGGPLLQPTACSFRGPVPQQPPVVQWTSRPAGQLRRLRSGIQVPEGVQQTRSCPASPRSRGSRALPPPRRIQSTCHPWHLGHWLASLLAAR